MLAFGSVEFVSGFGGLAWFGDCCTADLMFGFGVFVRLEWVTTRFCFVRFR